MYRSFKESGLGYIDPKQNRVITTHGFRSTFRDWSADMTDYPREVCEHVLAHKLSDDSAPRRDRSLLFLLCAKISHYLFDSV